MKRTNLFAVGLLSLLSYGNKTDSSSIDIKEEFFIKKSVLASAFGIDQNIQNPDVKNLLKSDDMSYLSNLENNQTLVVVDKSSQVAKTYSLELKLLDATLVSTGRAVGDKEKEGDLKTPDGLFSVVSKENSSDWIHNGKKGVYGNYFFRLDAGSWDGSGNYYPNQKSSIGLHGTNEPQKLGSVASEGCVRFSNEKNVEYAKKGILKKGTLVAIIDSKKNLTDDSQKEVFKPKVEGVYNGIKAKSN